MLPSFSQLCNDWQMTTAPSNSNLVPNYAECSIYLRTTFPRAQRQYVQHPTICTKRDIPNTVVQDPVMSSTMPAIIFPKIPCHSKQMPHCTRPSANDRMWQPCSSSDVNLTGVLAMVFDTPTTAAAYLGDTCEQDHLNAEAQMSRVSSLTSNIFAQ